MEILLYSKDLLFNLKFDRALKEFSMTRYLFVCSLFYLFLFNLSAQTYTGTAVSVKFKIGTRFGTADGSFKKSTLSVQDSKEGKATIEVDTSSIDTGNSIRDKHLKSDDFFDTNKYPKAVFQLQSLESTSEAGKFKGKGTVTIKGVSKELVFFAISSSSNDKDMYTGKLEINRKEFGINYDSMMNPIKDVAVVEFTVTLTK